MILFANSEGPDQTAHPRSLIWAFAVCTWPEGLFSPGGLIWCLRCEKNSIYSKYLLLFICKMLIPYNLHSVATAFWDSSSSLFAVYTLLLYLTGADSEVSVCVCGGGGGGEGGGRGSWGTIEPLFDSNFHFHGKLWINVTDLGYRNYPIYSLPWLFTLY